MAIIFGNDLESKQEKFLFDKKQRMTGALELNKRTYSELMSKHWADNLPGETLTVQERFDCYGDEAYKLFQYADALGQLILAVDPNAQLVTPTSFDYTYVINQDGSVTVTKVVP